MICESNEPYFSVCISCLHFTVCCQTMCRDVLGETIVLWAVSALIMLTCFIEHAIVFVLLSMYLTFSMGCAS